MTTANTTTCKYCGTAIPKPLSCGCAEAAEVRRQKLRADRLAGLTSAFLEAGERLAHYIGDSENRVETAWALRGLIETMVHGEKGVDARSDDAGEYQSDYLRGHLAAVKSRIDLA